MITSSRIAWGDQLGAQLSKLAELLYIAKENRQDLVLWEELKNYRRGYRFLDVFELPAFLTIIKRSSKSKDGLFQRYCNKYYGNVSNWRAEMNRIYNSRFHKYMGRALYEWIRQDYNDFELLEGLENGVHTDRKLLQLDSHKNYDLVDGFGTYQDWKKYESEIKNGLVFQNGVQRQAETIMTNWPRTTKKRVSIHFRRTDYIVLSSLNLSDEYYERAMSFFPPDEHECVVFSDDIEYCKTLALFKNRDSIFVEGNSAGVDMCLMSRCDCNVTANSTFSFWGAFLNKKVGVKVVCPHDFIGPGAQSAQYINGNYYPDDWIAI